MVARQHTTQQHTLRNFFKSFIAIACVAFSVNLATIANASTKNKSAAAKHTSAPVMAPSGSSSTTMLQEGWYRIVSGGQHVGFIVLRIEFDSVKKNFISTSYTQTNALAGNLKESLVAVSSEKLDPISYQFTSAVGDKIKTIDASFTKDVMTAKITENGQTTSVQNKLQKGAFLSQFLVYVILNNPKGLKVGNKFAYIGISEEDAQVQNGEAYVSSMEKINNIEVYKILNTFKGSKYISYVSPKGIMILTKDPVQSLSTDLVGRMEDAIKGFEVNRKTLSMLFKTLPPDILPKAEASASTSASGTANSPSAKTPPPQGIDVGEPHPDTNQAGTQDIEKLNKAAEGQDTTIPKGLSVPPGKGVQKGQ